MTIGNIPGLGFTLVIVGAFIFFIVTEIIDNNKAIEFYESKGYDELVAFSLGLTNEFACKGTSPEGRIYESNIWYNVKKIETE